MTTVDINEQAAAIRKDILVATRHILATDFRVGFFSQVGRAAPLISPHLHSSPHISPSLPTSPHSYRSPSLPPSPPISPHLPPSPPLSQVDVLLDENVLVGAGPTSLRTSHEAAAIPHHPRD